jgi:hypothetical protein
MAALVTSRLPYSPPAARAAKLKPVVMNRILPLLTALLLAGPALSQVPEMKSSDAKKLLKGVGNWVLADFDEDPAEKLDARDEVQKALDGLAKKYPGPEVFRYLDAWGEALAQRAGKYPKAKGGKLASDDTPWGRTLSYWVPNNYKPKDGGAPLVLWFRNSDLSEDDIAAIPANLQADYVVAPVVVPSAEGDELLTAARLSFFIDFIWLSKQLRIDRNRVYVLADSDHAAIAAKLCALAPHAVAGLSIVGEEGDLPAENMAMVAMNKSDSLDDAWAWLTEAPVRNPYPTEFSAELMNLQFGRVHWVHARKFDPSLDGSVAKISVKADRASNTITIDAENVYQVDLYLNDQIVDLAKPIKIIRNGQEIEVSTNAGFMIVLENYRTTLFDTGTIYPAKYSGIDIPPKE